MTEIEKYSEKMFEEIKHINESGNEYWCARELQTMLGYKECRYFSGVIEKNVGTMPELFQHQKKV